MPALTTIRTPKLAELTNELSFAGKLTILRHLTRIEQLAPAIDPHDKDALYPYDFIVFRITSYRPDIDAPPLITATDLLADLSAIAEHLCESASISKDDLAPSPDTNQPPPPTLHSINDLADRWSVSRKTIERYRRLGLIAHRVTTGPGHRAIVFTDHAITWFESTHQDRLGSAANFTRIPPHLITKVINDARRYKRRLNANRAQISTRIAQRIHRSPDAVRRILINHDNDRLNELNTTHPSIADRANLPDHLLPIFTMPPPPDRALQMSMLTDALAGKRSGTIAAKHNRSTPATTRAINRARAALIHESNLTLLHELPDPLVSLQPQSPNAPDSPIHHPDLDHPSVTKDLHTHAPTDLADLLTLLRKPTTAVIPEQTAQLKAAQRLTHTAHTLSQTLHPSTPSGTTLDLIETALRHLTFLSIKLTNTQLPLMLSTIEQQLGGPLDTLPPHRAIDILNDATQTTANAVINTIHRHDPNSKGTLAAPVNLALTRWATRITDIAIPPTPGKAERRILQGHHIQNWTHILHNRFPWITPPTILTYLDHAPSMTLPDSLDPKHARIITRRYALDHTPPWTLAQLAHDLDTTPLHAGRMSQNALKLLTPPK